jgi:tetratricopeptide (TPR) repeat protein
MIAPASRKIGKYEIRQKLGRGGMADVYLAQDLVAGYTVALKAIEHAPDRDTQDAIEAERRGAELQARLAAIDPHVVRVYDANDADGFFYVAMEYVDGQDLAELMRRGPLAVPFAVEVASKIARTLNNAHHLEAFVQGRNIHGIVHGDIKPKNIRIDARGEVRVLDFGIAKALSLSRRLTRNEFGSVPYASPERLESGEVNAQSDLWSLAVMLYEMLTGMQPYHADSTERLERMIRSHIPPPPAPEPVPEPLRRFLMKAMAPEPELRYADAREFAADLDAFTAGQTLHAASEDLDATRRTHRDTDPDATRRTGPAHDFDGDDTRRTAASYPPPAPVPVRRRRSVFGSFMRAVALTALVCLAYATYSAISKYLLYQHGQTLERQIKSEQLTDPDAIWAKWTELSKDNPSSLVLYGPRKAVRQNLENAADRVIDTYRNSDSQSVYEKDWDHARTLLQHALLADPDDTTRGKLRLVEGHIARINGTTHRDVPKLQEAIDDFEDARKLLPRSPDPDLGLARTFVYGLKDIDKAYDALQRAQNNGYKLGNREKGQLADGYRERADRTVADSRDVRGLPLEKEEIQRAADDYKRALELYQSIAPYGNSNSMILRVQSSLDTVTNRLKEIEAGNSPLGALLPLLWRLRGVRH